MQVKKIRLVGFKSFADETNIILEKGITAIVGPNGCGKSNIVDAVRWALGEKSSKALRGKSMEDVIFLGSETRKPAGMAEVEIYFDNTDRTLPVDLDEVIVSRRIYVNSSSEYLLNGKKTTRKEIDRILMDTGIGKTAYSIMEQGKMAEILKASPEERRFIFDEAAGISRFKSEKQETLKRLEDTKQNLLRLNDILKEKEKELNQLEKQARKTKQYLKLKEYLDKHDLNLRYLKYTSLKEKEEQVSNKLKELLNLKNQIFQNITKSELEIDELEQKNQKDLESMQNIEIEYHQFINQLESKKEEIKRMQEEEKNIKIKLEQLHKRLKSEAKYLKSIEKKYQESLQIELDLGQEIENIKQNIQIAENRIKEFQEKIQQTFFEEEQELKKIEQIENEYNQELEKLKQLTEELINNLQTRQKELKQGEEKRRILENNIESYYEIIINKILELKQLLLDGSINPSQMLNIIDSIPVEKAKQDFIQYKTIEQEFREIFFGETGVFSKKEEIDYKMNYLQQQKSNIQKHIKELYKIRSNLEKDIEKLKQQKVQMEILLRDYEVRKTTSIEARDSIKVQIDESKERLEFLQSEEKSYLHQLEYFNENKKKIEEEINQLKQKIDKSNEQLKNLKKHTKDLKEKIQALRKSAQKEREKIEKLLPEITTYERQEENLRVAIMNLEEELYNDFQMSPSELINICKDQNLNYEKEQKEYQRIKNEIQALGQFNALAIEQYEFSKKSFEELLKQKEDIENSEKNIKEIINKIDEKSKKLFLDTFERIQTNFESVFKTLFGGGNAQLSLTDPNNPLESGVQIMVQPPGKKNTSLSLLSGGEQNLTAIALMFAIYLVKPSPFCLLDEIDAPLDDNNVKRFLKMLNGFSNRSQFLVITHNKLTMAEANALFGVTQEEPGVSKIVSVKLDNLKEKHAI
ncbi:MAG: chromosome partition protein Smc [Leptospiraceae bacterium]|nr:MAG: chromosome partition protein Smc [Leptospiraceae bacterium]